MFFHRRRIKSSTIISSKNNELIQTYHYDRGGGRGYNPEAVALQQRMKEAEITHGTRFAKIEQGMQDLDKYKYKRGYESRKGSVDRVSSLV